MNLTACQSYSVHKQKYHQIQWFPTYNEGDARVFPTQVPRRCLATSKREGSGIWVIVLGQFGKKMIIIKKSSIFFWQLGTKCPETHRIIFLDIECQSQVL